MRKTIIFALIACILGIACLVALAFYIPGRFSSSKDNMQSELFTGFQFSTESLAKAASEEGGNAGKEDGNAGKEDGNAEKEGGEAGYSGKAVSSSLQDLPGDTIPGSKSGPSSDTSDAQASSNAQESYADNIRSLDGAEATVKAHQLIWVGDSRTLGLGNALGKAGRDDGDIFVGAVGEGVRWFREQGMSEMSDAIEQHSDLPVVLNFGVNDPQLVEEYIIAYRDVIDEHPDTDFYILSVNPIDEEFLIGDGQVQDEVFDDINSLNIARMNIRLKEEFESRYIDSASFLKSDGFETVDGLHYSTQTYLKIHDYVVDILF